MMTTPTVAVGGATLKDDETGNSSQAAATATAMALQNVLSAPPWLVGGPPGLSAADIARDGRNVAQKLSSRGDVDDGANDNGWF